jgi:diguanylate cyclase
MPYVNQLQVVESAQLSRLNSLSLRTVFANILLALLLAYIQRLAINTKVVLGWVILMLLFSLIRIIISQYYIQHPAENSQVHQRLNMHRLGVLITSSIWGANTFFVIGANQLEQQIFLIYMLCGLSAGAAMSYTIDRICALSYIYFAVIPLIIGFLMVGDEISYAMSIAGLIYVLFFTYSVVRFNQDLIESIILRHEAYMREEEIKQMAFYDALTNLPNRRLLIDRLEHALLVSKRMDKGGALLFIDINHFKELNDTQGHLVGDLLLKQVAERLVASVRESDTVARLGGDEFILVIENLSYDHVVACKEVDLIIEEILKKLGQPFNLEGTEYRCAVSVGIAMFGQHGNTYQALLEHADIAMYEAKRSGRNNMVRMFDDDIKSIINRKFN